MDDKGDDDSKKVDEKKRRFLTAATTVVGGIGVVGAATPFVASWMPSAKAQAAGAPVKVDLSKLEPGQRITVDWRGKPVWIIRRTQEALSKLDEAKDKLRDPHSKASLQPDYTQNKHRSIKPEYLVLVGLCTHLGCVPTYQPNLGELGPDWKGGFFCPCHGSTFDLAGRVFEGVPAPINLEVPPYRFIDDNTLVVGEHHETEKA